MAGGETPEKSGEQETASVPEVQEPAEGVEQTAQPSSAEKLSQERAREQAKLRATTSSEVDGVRAEQSLAELDEEDTADTGDVEDPDENTTDSTEEEDEEDEEEEEEDDFWGPVMEAYEKDGGWAAILVAIKLWTGWGDDEKKEAGESEDGENPLFRTDLFETDDPESKKLLETAKTELDKVKEDNPTWIDLAFKASEEYDLGPKGPATILAMAGFESHFNPEAVAESTQATGLGQFIEGTWDGFQASLDEDSPYKGKPATDPEASIMAIAWYSAENMKDCKIKPTDPEFTAKLYEAHHQGAQGAKTMWKFREEGKPEGEIPGWAKGKPFKSFGVEKVETYEDYALLVDAMSGKVQLVADMYQGEIEASDDNSDE